VSVAAQTIDSLVADVLERLSGASDLSEACSIALDRIVTEFATPRAALIVRNEGGLAGVGWNVPQVVVDTAIAEATDPEDRLVQLIAGGGEPALVPAARLPAFGFDACMLPVPGCRGTGLGVAIIETDEITDRTCAVAEVLRRVGPGLHRTLQLLSVQSRARRLDAQRDLLSSIVNALPDPVILSNEQNEILLTNARADELFAASDGDSEGRRRAIQINNLLFSSFLTQSVIGGHLSSRELNLVDPSEGSDLLFEILSMPLASSRGDSGFISILRDITDLKRAVTEMEVQFNRSRIAEHRARQERDRLNVILENVADPILLTDDKSNIILMNPEADRLFVVPPDADPDTPWARMVRANDTRFTTLISDFLLQSEAARVDRLDVTDPDSGRVFTAEVASTKISNTRGEPVAIVSVLHDLTQVVENQRLARELQLLNEELEQRVRAATVELERRNRQLEWQSAELERASRLKSEFLAAMSHELRTPLNVIIGYTSLIRDQIYGELSPSQDDALARVYTTSQHLLELINNILDLSKIEAGKMPLYIDEVDIPRAIAEISTTIMPMVERKQLTYTTYVDPALTTIVTDPTKFRQILLNLLSNAIKFTREGSVSISAGLNGDGMLRIEVADTGIGIREEHLGDIFEHFRQLDQSHTREFGGTGLGLTITQNLLAMLGGTISVQSTYGEGSRFIVELPQSIEPVLKARSAEE